MKWFRFYERWLDDPQIQGLDPILFRDWINILCVACRHDGVVTENVAELGYLLRCPPDQAARALQHFVEIAFLTKTKRGLIVARWDEMSKKSDTSTERVKRYRNVSVTGLEVISNNSKQKPNYKRVITKRPRSLRSVGAPVAGPNEKRPAGAGRGAPRSVVDDWRAYRAALDDFEARKAAAISAGKPFGEVFDTSPWLK